MISSDYGKELLKDVFCFRHQTTLAILDLNRMDDLHQLGQIFLTERENERYNLLKNEARKKEWLGARVCLKTLLIKEGIVRHPNEYEIAKDQRGRPQILSLRDSSLLVNLDCSLSHKGKYALAAISESGKKNIGADIEKISPKFQTLASRFSSRQDRLKIEHDRLTYPTLIWAVKEAVAKAHGKGLGIGFDRLACRETKKKFCLVFKAGKVIAEAEYFFYKDFVVAIAWAEKQRF
jgi:phosphopantetheinyl transferase